VVDGGEPGVDSRDEGKHTGRNDLLLQMDYSAVSALLRVWYGERVCRANVV